ncbi:MAG: inorganic diphosphatase [Nannocystaceae bacterium]
MIPEFGEIVEAVVEYPRLSMIKRRSDGRIDFVSPIPCPYNYGSIPGLVAGDGDPLDAVILGARLPVGARVRRPVVAVVDFIDDGAADPKVVLGAEPLSAGERRGLWLFFAIYSRFKRALARLRGSRRETRVRGLRAPPRAPRG